MVRLSLVAALGGLALALPLASALSNPVSSALPAAKLSGEAGPLAEVSFGPPSPAPSCPGDTDPGRALTPGIAPEDTSQGACLASAARRGNIAAARILGDAYARALTHPAPGANTGIDRYGREIMWYRAAAASGQPRDEIRLARALDFDPQVTMPDVALAYYTRAAHHGAVEAVDAVADAWAQGRIYPAQISEFRDWVNAQAPTHPALNRAAQRLNRAAEIG